VKALQIAGFVFLGACRLAKIGRVGNQEGNRPSKLGGKTTGGTLPDKGIHDLVEVAIRIEKRLRG